MKATPPLWRAIDRAGSVRQIFERRWTEAPTLGQPEARVFEGEFVVQFGMEHGLVSFAEQLAELAPLSLSICPVVVGVRADPDGIAAICLGYPACAGGRLAVPDRTAAEPLRLDDTALAALRQDLLALIAAGFDHPWALSGLGYLLRCARSGRLVVQGWGAVERFDPDDEDEAEERFDRIVSDIALLRSRYATH